MVSSKVLNYLGLLLVCLVGLIFMLLYLSKQPIWWDEASSVVCFNESSLRSFLHQERINAPPTVPFYFVLEYYWHLYVHPSPYSLRYLSMIFGVLSIALLYLIVQNLTKGIRGALIASLCMACSSAHIYYAQEIRNYSLLLFLTGLVILGLLYIFKEYWLGWVLTLVGCALIPWTHLMSIPFVLVVSAFLFLYWRQSGRLRLWVVWNALHIPNALLFLVYFMKTTDFKAVNDATPFKSQLSYSLISLLKVYALSAGATVYEQSAIQQAAMLCYAVFVVVLMGIMVYVLIKRYRQIVISSVSEVFAHYSIGLLGVLLIIPVAYYFFSLTVYPFFMHRYVFYASLGWFMLIGIFVSLQRPRTGYFFLILICGMNITQFAISNPALWRGHWLDIQQALLQEEDSPVVLDSFMTSAVLQSNLIKKDRIYLKDTNSTAEYAQFVVEKVSHNPYVWAVFVNPEKQPAFEAGLREKGRSFEGREFIGRSRKANLCLYKVW